MPVSLISAYERLLLHNLSAVATVESGIRNITWLLPGRFEDAEVASEGLYALLSLVTSYHDTIVARRITPILSLPPHPFASASAVPNGNKERVTPQAPQVPQAEGHSPPRISPILPPPTDHTRYTRYWMDHSVIYKKAARAISILGYVELLVEMLARKRGDRSRWRLVLFIESIKTFLRLIILRLTRRPVLLHPTPMRQFDPSTLPSLILNPISTPSPTNDTAQGESQSASSNSDAQSTAAISTMHGSTLRNHLIPLTASLPESHKPHPLSLLPELDPRGYLAEVLTCSATLMHVVLLLRWARHHPIAPYKPLSLPTLSRSLPPFLIPLAMRLLARRLRSASSQYGGTTDLLASHNAAQDRRTASAFFFTGPMWVGWTRPKITSWIEWLERWPVVGIAGSWAGGYLPLVDDYYYYTSS